MSITLSILLIILLIPSSLFAGPQISGGGGGSSGSSDIPAGTSCIAARGADGVLVCTTQIQLDDSAAQIINAAAPTKLVKIDASNQGAGQTGIIQAPVNGTAVLVKTGTYTNTKWCQYTTVSGLACDQDAPAGTPALDDVTNPDAAKAFTLVANNQYALEFVSAAVAHFVYFDTRTGAAGVSITGYLTASGLGTFGTLSAGAGGFTVDADGDVVGKSFSTTRTDTPQSIQFYEATSDGNYSKTFIAPAVGTGFTADRTHTFGNYNSSDVLSTEVDATGHVSKRWSADYRILLPTTADDYPITILEAASTLTTFRGTCVGGTSITLTLQYCDADGVSNCAALVNEDTITCGTAKNFSLAATAIPTGVKTIRVLAGTVTGTVTYVLATAAGTIP
jgi:hypothetical protein